MDYESLAASGRNTERQIIDGKLPFTQFLRPNGRMTPIFTVLEDETGELLQKAQIILDRGYNFEIEILMNGIISMTICGYCPECEEDRDIVMELSANGPHVQVKIKEMIEKFNLDIYKGKP